MIVGGVMLAYVIFGGMIATQVQIIKKSDFVAGRGYRHVAVRANSASTTGAFRCSGCQMTDVAFLAKWYHYFKYCVAPGMS